MYEEEQRDLITTLKTGGRDPMPAPVEVEVVEELALEDVIRKEEQSHSQEEENHIFQLLIQQ